MLHYLTQHLRRDVAHLTRLSFYQRTIFCARLHDACAIWKSWNRCTTMRRAMPALRRAESDRDADGRAALARLALAAAGCRRSRFDRRQEAVQTLIEQRAQRWRVSARSLAEVRDLERTIGRLSAGTGNARDLVALRTALEQIPALERILRELACGRPVRPRSPLNEEVLGNGAPPLNEVPTARTPAAPNWKPQLAELPDLVELIGRAIRR